MSRRIVDRGGQLSSTVSTAEAIAEGAESITDVNLG